MKIKNCALLFFSCVLSFSVIAQVPELVPYHQGDKWGYSDNTGKIVIEPVYEAAELFSDGLASVMSFGKWGSIDKTGKIIIAPAYPQSINFYNGFSIARNDASMYGLLDKTGKAVIPFKYTELSFGALDANGNPDNSQNIYEAVLDGNHGFIDAANKTIVPVKYRGTVKFSGGIAWCLKGYKYGAVDRKGKTLSSFKYTNGGQFKNGLSAVYTSEDHNILYGFVNKDLSEVVPLKYKYCGNFEGGLAEVQNDGKSGFINSSGTEIIPLKYEQVTPFNSKYGYAGFKLNNKHGVIDSTGKEIFSAEYDNVQTTTDGIFVSKNGKWAMLDPAGRLGQFKFSEVAAFSDDLACVKMNAKYGFINRKGETVIPFIYSSNGYFINGHCAVKYQGKYGVINKEGKAVITFKYDNIVYSGNNLFDVTLSDNYNGYMDVNGTKYFDKSQVPLPVGMMVKNIWNDNIKFEGVTRNFANLYVPDKGLYLICSKQDSKRTLMKYDESGTKVSEKTLDSLSGVSAIEIMLDKNISIINWNNGGKENNPFSIAKSDTIGKILWKKTIKNIHILSSACDQAGDIYMAGYLNGDFNTDNVILKKLNKTVAEFPTALFVMKLSPAGKVLWAKEFKTDLPFGSLMVSVSPEGKMAVAGNTAPSGLPSAAILYLIDPTGKLIYGKQFKTPNSDKQTDFSGVLTDKEGNIHSCGASNDKINFISGANTENDANAASIFFIKYNIAGKQIYLNNFRTTFTEEMPTNLKLIGMTAEEVVISAKPVILKINVLSNLVQKFDLSAGTKADEEFIGNEAQDIFPVFSYNGAAESLVKISTTTFGPPNNASTLIYVVKQKLVK